MSGVTATLTGLTISGGSAVDGGGIDNAGTLTLTNSAIDNNSATLQGGGIDNAGTLTLSNSTIDNNSAGAGGGIDNSGALTVTNCTIADNEAGGSGGTVTLDVMAWIDGRDDLIIQGNTLQWDHFDYAAVGRADGNNYPTIITTTLNGVTEMNGVDWIPTWPDPPPNNIRFPAVSSVFTGLTPEIPATTDVTLTAITARESLTIVQSPGPSNDFTTILEFNDDVDIGQAWYEGLLTFASENGTAAYGGGIANVGTLTVVNSTVADNNVASGGLGGGLDSIAGTATLDNTIVALNTSGTGSSAPADDIAGTVSSASAYNLVGTGGSGGLSNGYNGDLVGVVNPGLGTLADDGGPTPTIALLPGSPAINAGSNALAVNAREAP